MLAGLRVRRVALGCEDVVTLRGFRVTSVERTLADLSPIVGLAETVVLVDTATHLRLTTVQRLEDAASRAVRRAGIRTFHRAIALAEPAAESQMESRLRMVIVLRGLPKPLVQHTLYDQSGKRLGRPDLYYPQARLGIEYDGEVHEGRLAQDNRRQNALLAAGYRLLRFTAGDVYNDPEKIVAQVRAMLNETRSC